MAGTYDIETDSVSAKLILPDGETGEIKKVERKRLARGSAIRSGDEIYITDRVVWKNPGKGYLCVIHLIDVSTWEQKQIKQRKQASKEHLLWFAFGVVMAILFASLWYK